MRALAALAVLLAALPYIAGFLDAPRGSVFLGALNNVGDTGQYLAALRQGAEGHLLYVNQYSNLRVPPVLMYPFYTLTGLLLSPLHLSSMVAYQLLHLVTAIALLAALWRLCRLFAPRRPGLAYALALFGGGLYVPALLASGLVQLPFAPVALTAPEFSLFATLLISPHGALGLAAELWALCGYLLWQRDRCRRGLGVLGAGGLALGLCYPFGMVVLLGVVAVDIVLSAIRSVNDPPDLRRGIWQTPMFLKGGRMPDAPTTLHPGASEQVGTGPIPSAPTTLFKRTISCILPPALALLPTAGIALYYALLFRHDPLWGASNMLRLPPPSFAVLVAAYGPLLALALPSVWRRPHLPTPMGGISVGGVSPLSRGEEERTLHPPAPVGSVSPPSGGEGEPRHCHRASPEEASLLPRTGRVIGWAVGAAAPRDHSSERRWVGGEGLLLTWGAINGLLLLAPLPQTERLLNGWSVALALLATQTLQRVSARAARRWVMALSCSNALLALLYLSVTLHAGNPAYYAPQNEMAAVKWLAAHTHESDIVMASAGSGNLIVSAARCRVVVGQNFETFNWANSQRDVLRFYASTTSPVERAAIVRRHGVTLALAGPYERALGGFVPRGPGYRLVYQSGAVRIFAVKG